MQIVKKVNSSWKALPIPEKKIPLPANVIGFERIEIKFLDHNVMAFLHGIRRLFDSPGIDLRIDTLISQRNRVLGLILANIWPLIKGNISRFFFFILDLDALSRLHLTILNECSQLITVNSGDIFPDFTVDSMDNSSTERVLANWLRTTRGDGIPKMLQCIFWLDDEFSSQMGAIQEEFVTSSSRVNFIMVTFAPSSVSIVPFDLNNELTGERLTLKRFDDHNLLLVRCPISRDEKQPSGRRWRLNGNGITNGRGSKFLLMPMPSEMVSWKMQSKWGRVGSRSRDKHRKEQRTDRSQTHEFIDFHLSYF